MVLRSGPLASRDSAPEAAEAEGGGVHHRPVDVAGPARALDVTRLRDRDDLALVDHVAAQDARAGLVDPAGSVLQNAS